VVSDIHLEFPKVLSLFQREYPSFFTGNFPNDYIALIGDIAYPTTGDLKDFLAELTRRFKKVFYLAGNHEFYQGEYYSAKERLKEICHDVGVLFMDKTKFKDTENKIVFLGTTLWSFVPEENARQVQICLNDYHMIKIENSGIRRLLSVQDTNAWHADELAWLKENIQQESATGNRVVVLTHHAPTFQNTSDPKYRGDPISCAFATDLEYLMGAPITLWSFGHTHFSSSQTIKGTRLVSNQLGYIHNREQSGFNPNLTIEI